MRKSSSGLQSLWLVTGYMENTFSDFRVALLASFFGRKQVREPAGMVFIIDFSELG